MQHKTPGSVTIATARTLLRRESGLLFVITAADLKVTLPPWEEGLYYDFRVEALSDDVTGTGFQIDPVAADKINGNAVDLDWINTAATDAIGDGCRCQAGSVAGEWWIHRQRGIWASE